MNTVRSGGTRPLLLLLSLLGALVAMCGAVGVTPQYTTHAWASQSFGAVSSLTTVSDDPTVFTNLTVEAIFVTDTMMRLRVYPATLKAGQAAPFVVPDVVLPNNGAPANATTAAKTPKYLCSYSSTGEDGGVLRVEDRAAPFKTLVALRNVVFQDQLVSFQTEFSGTTEKLFGYGEHDYYYFLNHKDNTTLSLWNTDNGTPWKKPMYGVHPVVFHSDPTYDRHFGVFWANSHAQQMHMLGDAITYTAVGGIIDLYVVLDTTPLGVVQQYHAIVGPSAVPPYWSLGTHQCRWGYHNLSEVEAVVAGYEAAGIPLEVMWNDIDYMDQFRVFTTDPVRYPQAQLKAFIDSLHAKKMRYIQITDPGVAQANSYSVYTSGIAADAFVKTQTGQPLVNVVWPGFTVFPDFTSDAVGAWWGQQVAEYRANVPVDGMWLDMNELGTFCAGQCDVAVGTPWSANWKTIDWSKFTEDICIPNNCTVVNSPLNFPPVNPLDNGYQLFNKTLDMTGQLAAGAYYDTKAFYGLMEERATYFALLAQTGERPFLLSRASFAGSGRYTAHWTGDNNAAWAAESGGIVDSIQAVLAANLWGIPMVGADIGGFSGTTTEELIVRWYQLGAFYTFTRNHHDLQGPGQEPYRFSEQAQAAIKTAIATKYALLPYMFTYLMLAHQNQGPVLRHMSLQFPTDANTYTELNQFMVGDAILVTPVVEEGATGGVIYVPGGTWYFLSTGSELESMSSIQTTGEYMIYATTPYGDPFVLVRGGYVVPMHPKPAMTVSETQASGISLKVYMDATDSAIGQVQLATDAPLATQNVTQINFIAVGNLAAGSLASISSNALSTNPLLTARVPVFVHYPTCVELAQNATFNITIDGVVEVDPTTITNMTCRGFMYYLPLGKDGSTVFTMEWAVNVMPTPPPPAPESSNTGVIVGATVGSVAGVALIAGVVYFLKMRAARSHGIYEDVQSAMRQEL